MARRPARDDDETPPWMERDPAPPPRRTMAAARAPEPGHTLVTWRALIIGAVLAVVAAVGLIWGVRSLIAREPGAVAAAGAPGEVPLIRAPAEPYKVKPLDAGGAQLAGAGDRVIAGDGADGAGATIDTSAAPETPQRPAAAPTDLLPGGPDAEAGDAQAADAGVPRRAAPAPAPFAATRAEPGPQAAQVVAIGANEPAPKPKPKPKPVAVKPARAPVEVASAGQFRLPDDLGTAPKAAKPTAVSGGSLQLGAFSTREKAQAAWARFAAAFPDVAALHERIEPLQRDGQTLYRLRAGGAGARAASICDKMKAAGDACIVSP